MSLRREGPAANSTDPCRDHLSCCLQGQEGQTAAPLLGSSRTRLHAEPDWARGLGRGSASNLLRA